MEVTSHEGRVVDPEAVFVIHAQRRNVERLQEDWRDRRHELAKTVGVEEQVVCKKSPPAEIVNLVRKAGVAVDRVVRVVCPNNSLSNLYRFVGTLDWYIVVRMVEVEEEGAEEKYAETLLADRLVVGLLEIALHSSTDMDCC